MFPTLVSHSDSDLTNKLNAVLPTIRFQLKEVLCSGVEVLWLGVAVDGGRPGGHPRTRDITGSVRIMPTPRIEGSVTVESLAVSPNALAHISLPLLAAAHLSIIIYSGKILSFHILPEDGALDDTHREDRAPRLRRHH